MSRPPLPGGDDAALGPYKHAHRIAVGGMAEVFRALAPQAAGGDRAVVLKRLLPELAEQREQREMFEHEARLGARIDHPNVVAVLDHGELEGQPYIALEYVFGVDLYRLQRWSRQSERPIDRDVALYVGCELLEGLAAVHAAVDEDGAPLEVVHRDVSPANVFLSVHGDVKLGDLGIARAALGRQGGASMRAKGKLGYLPPEQVAGQEVDQRGDIFSAAVVVAELLMGRPLFAGGTEIGVLLAIRAGDISAFHAIAHTLPSIVAGGLVEALERKPRDRTETAIALRQVLAAAIERPREDLRRDLGHLVVGALDAVEPERDTTSLARTVEADAALLERITPVAAADVDAMRESGPLYRVERDGREVGLYTLAQLVRALTTDQVRATDLVRADDDEARGVASVPELARHLPASTRTPMARQRTQMAQTSEVYDLAARPMLDILIEARLTRESGLLLCARDTVRKEIYLTDGKPCFATSNQPDDMLGECLVRAGRIDRSELDLALAVMPRFEGRLGETLLALGLIDAVTLFRSIADQVSDRVLDVMMWPAGHAALYREVDPPERAFPLELDAWDLLAEGARRRMEVGLAKPLPRDAVLRPGSRDPEDLALPDLLLGIGLACRGPRTVSELGGITDGGAAFQGALDVLLRAGVLDLAS